MLSFMHAVLEIYFQSLHLLPQACKNIKNKKKKVKYPVKSKKQDTTYP